MSAQLAELVVESSCLLPQLAFCITSTLQSSLVLLLNTLQLSSPLSLNLVDLSRWRW